MATTSFRDALVHDVSTRLLDALRQVLLAESTDLPHGSRLRLECTLGAPSESHPSQHTSISTSTILFFEMDIQEELPSDPELPSYAQASKPAIEVQQAEIANGRRSSIPAKSYSPPASKRSILDEDSRAVKRRATGGLTVAVPSSDSSDTGIRRLGSDARVFPQRKKRMPDNPSLQPSSLDKFINGIFESLYSGISMNPDEVIEQWQAIESNGQPKLLTDTCCGLRTSSAFGRMSTLTRKIVQTSRTCRSLEVIVQARWVQAFHDRVTELSSSITKEKAKKSAMSEACLDFNWSEKELRNKMAVWTGYHEIQKSGGWAALVFAGMGLYRFCKYRVAFTEDTFRILKALRHRFEVAADTLHPGWRSLLAIVGAPTDRKYSGHPHDWVVGGPGDEALPLPITYHQWDPDFSYTHLDESLIDEDAWGLFDPRTVIPATDIASRKCQVCGEHQSDDPRQNSCACFPSLFGSTRRPGSTPVQVYRTPNGKNNGLLACCAFERGAAVGEFAGQITSGLSNLDVMVGQTDRAAYQIWQGKQGNHTRFVNHSCQPNSQFERFVWLGTQRIVLVSKGIDAGDEITVDYSDTYWKNLDKDCLCGQPRCRYRNQTQLLTPPESA